MKIHELKTLPSFYDLIKKGNKLFEIRKNDRGFKVGDVLFLREICPCEPGTPYSRENVQYTGRKKAFEITYITDWEQKPDFVVMAIKVI